MNPIVLGVGAAAVALAWWVMGAPAAKPQEVAGRLAGLEVGAAAVAPSKRPSARRGLQAFLSSLGRAAEPALRSAAGDASLRRLETSLWLIGSPLSASEFLVMAVGSGVVAMLGAMLVTAVLLHDPWGSPAAVLFPGLAFAGGTAASFLGLKLKVGRTLRGLVEQLPDALMLLLNALRAGNSFLSAMQIVARQIPDPLATQLGITLAEVNMGLGLDEALVHLQDRVPATDVELLVGALLVQRETGGNMSEILNNLHDTLRDRLRIQGEIKALTAQGRLSGWVLSLLPTGVGGLFFLVNPRYILGLLTDPRGQLMVAGAFLSQGLGVWAIRRIVDVKY